MDKEQKYYHHKAMYLGYFRKLRELKTYGKEHKNPERIADVKSSIRVLAKELVKPKNIIKWKLYYTF